MSAPKSHIIKSAVWTPTGGTAVTITGLQDANVEPGGTRHTWSGDGAATVQAQSMEDIEAMATVTSTDLALALNVGLKIGTAGSLAIVYAQRGPRGAASSGDITRTLGDAIVERVREGAPHRGQSTLEITWGAVAHTGDPVTYTT
jgi:hypothetical protein